MQQNIALPDGIEPILARHRRRGNRGRERLKFQIGPIHEVGHRHQPVEIDRPMALIDVARVEVELFSQEIDEVVRTVVRYFKPYFVTEAPIRKLTFEGPPKIVDVLLIDEEIAVPGDTELVTAGDAHAGKELMDKGVDDRREERKIVRPCGMAHRQVNYARERTRDLHDGGPIGAPEGIGSFEGHQKVETLVE